MAYRALMVMRMDPGDAGAVSDIFAAHDDTGLPREIGATGRSLFRFHDLYMHLIEGEVDVVSRLPQYRDHPTFRETDEQLRRFLRPYSPQWRQLSDSQAEIFYTRRWE